MLELKLVNQDHSEYKQQGIFSQIKNKGKTYMSLNNSEALFLDFKRKTFVQDVAIPKYLDIQLALKKKDKLLLQQTLSFSLQELFKQCMKEKTPIPYKLFTENQIISPKLVQCRQFQQNKNLSLKNLTWHQITIEFQVLENEQNIQKVFCLERRESDLKKQDWKVCYLE